MNYPLIQPPFALDFPGMSKRELAEYRTWFFDILQARIRILEEAIQTSQGFEWWRADKTPQSLDGLGKWFVTKVETRIRTREELWQLQEQTPAQFKDILPVELWDLTNRTYSLAMDCGMYLGLVMLHTHPLHLRWDQDLRDKRDADYGQMLIVGTGVVSMNVVGFLIGIANSFVRKTGNKDLRTLYDLWSGPDSGLFTPSQIKKVRKPRN